MLPKKAFTAELANGHRIVAYLAGPEKARADTLRIGDTVTVQMSPYDMSRGRIVGPDWKRNDES